MQISNKRKYNIFIRSARSWAAATAGKRSSGPHWTRTAEAAARTAAANLPALDNRRGLDTISGKKEPAALDR